MSRNNVLKNVQLNIYNKISTLLSTILAIMPIITKFFPIFMIVYYFFGIVGMEIFYETYQTTANTTYSFYA
jgi:hypothetical protein